MKIAFLILNHRGPEQVLRLLWTLRSQLPDAPLTVHHDRFHLEVDANLLAPLGDAHLITSDAPIRWGDFSIVDATWRSLEWMTANLTFDWIVILSGQDYPIKPLSGLPGFLSGTGADVLLSAAPVSDLPRAAQRRNMRRRYFYQYRNLRSPIGYRGPLWVPARQGTALAANVLNNIQPYFSIYSFADEVPWRAGLRARSVPFTAGRPCWFGSTWFALARPAAEYLISFVQNNVKYVEYYRRTVHPDESATATILCNAPGLRVERLALHYVRWTHPKSGHPDVLTSADLGGLRNSPAYFARKFDMAVDAQILDRLDAILAGSSTLRPPEAAGAGGAP